MNLDDPAPKWPPANSSDELRLRELATWIDRHRFTYTRPALEASAAGAGYTREEFEAAWPIAEVFGAPREAHRGRVKWRARAVVLVAYGLTWILFAIAYLRPLQTASSDQLNPLQTPGYGQFMQAILTIALGTGFAISWVWTRSMRPDPERLVRALAVLLSVPVVLLVGVAGLCLPYLPG